MLQQHVVHGSRRRRGNLHLEFKRIHPANVATVVTHRNANGVRSSAVQPDYASQRQMTATAAVTPNPTASGSSVATVAQRALRVSR